MLIPGGKSKINRKQEAAVAALLTAPTLAEAAKAAGISLITLQRWLKQEAFKEAYQRAKREVMERAIGRVQQVAEKAVGVLEELMTTGEKENVRCQAAKTLLETALRVTEIADLARRVEELEKRLEVMQSVRAFTGPH